MAAYYVKKVSGVLRYANGREPIASDPTGYIRDAILASGENGTVLLYAGTYLSNELAVSGSLRSSAAGQTLSVVGDGPVVIDGSTLSADIIQALHANFFIGHVKVIGSHAGYYSVYIGTGLTKTTIGCEITDGVNGIYMPKTTTEDIVLIENAYIHGLTGSLPAIKINGTADALGKAILQIKKSRIVGNNWTALQFNSCTSVDIDDSIIIGNGRYSIDALYGGHNTNLRNSIIGSGGDKTVNKSANYTGEIVFSNSAPFPKGKNSGLETIPATLNSCIDGHPQFIGGMYDGVISVIVDDTYSIPEWLDLADYCTTVGVGTAIAINTLDMTDELWASVASRVLDGHEILCHTRSHPFITNIDAFDIVYTGAGVGKISISTDVTDDSSDNWSGSLALTVDDVLVAAFPLTLGKAGSHPEIYNVINKIESLDDWSATLNPLSSSHILSTVLEPINSVVGASPVTINYSQSALWHSEIAEAKKYLESKMSSALGYQYVCRGFVVPSSTTSDDVQDWCVDPANFISAGTTAFDMVRVSLVGTSSTLNSIDLSKVMGYPITGVTNPSIDINSLLLSLCNSSLNGPQWVCIYGHLENLATWREWIDRIVISGIRCELPGYFGSEIKQSGLWSLNSGSLWTRTFNHHADYHLQPTSPCIGAGTAIAGITTDIEGNQLYPPYNIGPYGAAEGALETGASDHTGQAKLSFTRVSGTGEGFSDTDVFTASDSHQMRIITGWTHGTANALYDGNGVPIEVTGAQLKAFDIGPLLWIGDSKWLAFKSTSEAKRALKVPVAA